MKMSYYHVYEQMIEQSKKLSRIVEELESNPWLHERELSKKLDEVALGIGGLKQTIQN